MRSRQPVSVLFGGLIAVITLVMVVVLPIISRDTRTAAPTTENIAAPLLSPHMQALDLQRTMMVPVEGGAFFRGTMPDEAEESIELCEVYGWQCDIETAENSYPAHRLRVDTFWMELNEVTYAQYVTFLNTMGPGSHQNGCLGEACVVTQAEDRTSSIAFNGANYVTSNPAIDDYPVVSVTWYGAQAYCEALGRRLPTEAEWEFAARGTDNTLYPWGNEWVFEAANVRGSSLQNDGVIIAGAQPVGGYPDYASRDGIRDLAGNVAEWVADWYADDHYLQLDVNTEFDTGPATGIAKVVRGGSWNDYPFFARSVHRRSMIPLETSRSVGFRCVADA